MKGLSGIFRVDWPLMSLLLSFFFVSASPAQSSDNRWHAVADPRLSLEWGLLNRGGQPRLSAAERMHPGRRVVVLLAGPDLPVTVGLRLISRSAETATAILDLERLPEVASDPAVLSIRPERRIKPLDDPGVISIRAERVPPKLGLTGRGVILGVMDSGLDWTHRDFLNPDGGTRILALLDLSDHPDSLGPGDPGEPGPYGGILYKRETIEQALATGAELRQRDYMGHGTHVTGTAAATPAAPPDTLLNFGGPAPLVDIVFVKISSTPRDSFFSDFNIMNGARFIDSLADALGKPYVINMSFGENLGPHDGSGTMDRFLAALVTGDRPGRTMVAAAGNERNLNQHAAGDFTLLTDSLARVNVNVSGGAGPHDEMRVEIWLGDNHPGVELTVVSPAGRLFGPYPDGFARPGEALVTPDGVLVVDNAHGGPRPQNDNRRITVDLYDPAAIGFNSPADTAGIRNGVWEIRLKAGDGKFDAYVAGSSGLNVSFTSFQTQSGTVSSPAAHPELIAVGAYTARHDFPSLDPSARMGSEALGQRTPGSITSFSSLGPNRKGVLKPELAAPGQWVMASFSRWADPRVEPLSIYRAWPTRPLLLIAPDSIHAVSQGTSFSAPHVAGLCALLLEADPGLTNGRIRDLLISTATADSMTGNLPDNTWGYGRANAVGAARMLLGVKDDSLALEASMVPADTIREEGAVYSVMVDFTGSAEVLRAFRADVSYPPGLVAPELTSGSSGVGNVNVRTVFDDSRMSEGLLGVTVDRSGGAGVREELFRIHFHPRSTLPSDSVNVRLDLLSLTGDFPPFELASRATVFQVRPVSIRAAGLCPVAGDVDGDGRRDIFDLLALLRILSGVAPANACSDLDRNGVTDIFDLLALLGLLKQ